jgi:hypothetical protein
MSVVIISENSPLVQSAIDWMKFKIGFGSIVWPSVCHNPQTKPT